MKGEGDQIITENNICPECKSMPTHHKFNVCGTVVCTQYSSGRVFDELNNVWCKECNHNPVKNPIFHACLQLPMNHTCTLCGIIVCYSCFQIRGKSENNIQ